MKRKPLTLGALSESAWLKLWKGTKNAPTVQSNLRKILEAFGEDQQVHRITTKMVEEVCHDWLEEGSSEKTCNRRLSCLSKMLKWAERRGQIQKAPYLERFSEGQGRLRYASEEEELQMIRGLSEAGYALFADLVAVLADTGMRRNEVLSMSWDQLEEGVVRLDETKNGRMRKVPLTQRAQRILEGLPREGHGPFEAIAPSTFSDAWNRVKRSMGLEEDRGFVPHCLRHAFACRLLQRGARIEVVSRLLGHDDISTTIKRYYHESPGDTSETVALLEPKAPGSGH